jgi:hypothetical protein
VRERCSQLCVRGGFEIYHTEGCRVSENIISDCFLIVCSGGGEPSSKCHSTAAGLTLARFITLLFASVKIASNPPHAV